MDAQKIIESGALGRIVEVEWHYDRYRTNVTHKKWKEDNLPGSGTWFDLGIHMVDSMLCLFGKPNAVYADMRSLRRRRFRGCNQPGQILLAGTGFEQAVNRAA